MYVYAYIHTYILIYTHTGIRVCVYIHIYTRIRTHTLFDLQLYKTSVLTTLLLVFYPL